MEQCPHMLKAICAALPPIYGTVQDTWRTLGCGGMRHSTQSVLPVVGRICGGLRPEKFPLHVTKGRAAGAQS